MLCDSAPERLSELASERRTDQILTALFSQSSSNDDDNVSVQCTRTVILHRPEIVNRCDSQGCGVGVSLKLHDTATLATTNAFYLTNEIMTFRG